MRPARMTWQDVAVHFASLWSSGGALTNGPAAYDLARVIPGELRSDARVRYGALM
jgi:hypothetical protein